MNIIFHIQFEGYINAFQNVLISINSLESDSVR